MEWHGNQWRKGQTQPREDAPTPPQEGKANSRRKKEGQIPQHPEGTANHHNMKEGRAEPSPEKVGKANPPWPRLEKSNVTQKHNSKTKCNETQWKDREINEGRARPNHEKDAPTPPSR